MCHICVVTFIETPLMELLKNESFSWTEEETTAFENLSSICVQLSSWPHLTLKKKLFWSVMPRAMELV
jgi:hypothetical protein